MEAYEQHEFLLYKIRLIFKLVQILLYNDL